MAVGHTAPRAGTAADLSATFGLCVRTTHEAAVEVGVASPEDAPTVDQIAARWERERPLVEFIAAQPDGAYWVVDGDEGPVAYARTVRFGTMEELTELAVDADHRARGLGRALLERCWPGDPTPDVGRLVVAVGAAADLSLYTSFGVMPSSGHWQMRQRTEDYLHRRAQEIDASEPAVHLLTPDRAVAEWQRLEPPAVGHERPALHEFFGRDRICLAGVGEDGRASGLCWVREAEIGPAVGETPEDLVPVLLAALDRVAKTHEPEHLSVSATTISWWLLRRLRTLGFRVHWPGWVMSSVPLPSLDRYVPMRPPHLL